MYSFSFGPVKNVLIHLFLQFICRLQFGRPLLHSGILFLRLSKIREKCKKGKVKTPAGNAC